jgi:negative regulator of flagellin synthesis FlgM
MDITKIQNIFKSYGEQSKVNKTAKSEKVAPAMKKDEVILSSQTQAAGQLYQGIYQAPDIREDKVKDLSAQIAAGNYHVDAKDIAEKMLRRNSDI